MSIYIENQHFVTEDFSKVLKQENAENLRTHFWLKNPSTKASAIRTCTKYLTSYPGIQSFFMNFTGNASNYLKHGPDFACSFPFEPYLKRFNLK